MLVEVLVDVLTEVLVEVLVDEPHGRAHGAAPAAKRPFSASDGVSRSSESALRQSRFMAGSRPCQVSATSPGTRSSRRCREVVGALSPGWRTVVAGFSRGHRNVRTVEPLIRDVRHGA